MDQSRYELIAKVKKILASLKRRGIIVSWRVDPVFAFFKYVGSEHEARLPLEAVLRWARDKTFDRYAGGVVTESPYFRKRRRRVQR